MTRRRPRDALNVAGALYAVATIAFNDERSKNEYGAVRVDGCRSMGLWLAAMTGREARTAVVGAVAVVLIGGCGSQRSAEGTTAHRAEAKARKVCVKKALAHGGSPEALLRCASEEEAAEKRRLEHPSAEAERILEERGAEKEAGEIEAAGATR